GVLSYTIEDKNVATSLLPEPYSTLVELGRYSKEGIDKQVVDVDSSNGNIAGLYNLMPYVVLTRQQANKKHSAEEKTILSAIRLGINKLRQDIYTMDVVEAKKIADFLNWLPQSVLSQSTYKFDALEISKALHNSEFKCRMPIAGEGPGLNEAIEQ